MSSLLPSSNASQNPPQSSSGAVNLQLTASFTPPPKPEEDNKDPKDKTKIGLVQGNQVMWSDATSTSDATFLQQASSILLSSDLVDATNGRVNWVKMRSPADVTALQQAAALSLTHGLVDTSGNKDWSKARSPADLALLQQAASMVLSPSLLDANYEINVDNIHSPADTTAVQSLVSISSIFMKAEQGKPADVKTGDVQIRWENVRTPAQLTMAIQVDGINRARENRKYRARYLLGALFLAAVMLGLGVGDYQLSSAGQTALITVGSVFAFALIVALAYVFRENIQVTTTGITVGTPVAPSNS